MPAYTISSPEPSAFGSGELKIVFFQIILTKIAIPSAKYCYHILFDMIHQTHMPNAKML